MINDKSFEPKNHVHAQADQTEGSTKRATTTDEVSQLNNSNSEIFPFYADPNKVLAWIVWRIYVSCLKMLLKGLWNVIDGL